MKTPILLVFSAALVALLGYLLWPDGEQAPPPTNDRVPTATGETGVEARDASDASGPAHGRVTTAVRSESTAPTVIQTYDPSVRAALVGFVGRVVTPDGEPLPDSVVRLYRGAADIAFPTAFDVRKLAGLGRVDLVAAEDTTDDEGRFHLDGAFPQGIFAMLADAEGDRPSLRLIEQAPAPGEQIDLGDIVLEDLAVLTGRVLDFDGNPVAGADIWALDLPGAVAAGANVFPFQRLDLDGYVVTDEGIENVWTPPAWAVDLIRDLPLPITETGVDGRFRLGGVQKGSNVFVVRSTGLEPILQSALIVQSDEKDLGDLTLGEGEVAGGIVTDSEGEPVAGAEVIIGQASSGAPIHLASVGPSTDAEGRFEQAGFGNGDVIAAARRTKDDPWTISEQVRVIEDLQITLPTPRTLTVTVLDEKTRDPIDGVEFQLLRGHDEEAIQTALWGLSQPVGLTDRVRRDEDANYLISGIPDDEYTLLASAEGYATGVAELDVEESTEVSLTLPAPLSMEVTILDPQGQPAKGTRVFVRPDGKPSFPEDGIVQAGRVDDDGHIVIDEVFGTSVKVTAQHPAFGNVHGEFRYDDQSAHVLQFALPGRIEGFVFDGREPPPLGKYTLAVAKGGFNREAALPDNPRLVTHAEDGAFRVEALSPGTYTVVVLDSLTAMNSIGDVTTNLGMRFFMMSDMITREVEVLAGQTSEVRIDTTEGPVFDGPTVQVSGVFRINGAPASGMTLMVFGQRRKGVELDAAGQFDLGQMPVGSLWMTLIDAEDASSMNFGEALWNNNVELTEGQPLYLNVDIETAPVAGYVFRANGSPAAGVEVNLWGTTRSPQGVSATEAGSEAHAAVAIEEGDSFNFSAVTDESGYFELEQARAGFYTFSARRDGERGQVRLEVPRVVGNRAVRIQMGPTVKIRGRIDFSAMGLEEPPEWSWLSLEPVADGGPGDLKSAESESAEVEDDGTFVIDDVTPGRYRWALWISSGSVSLDHTQILDVGVTDIDGLVLRPQPQQQVPVPAVIDSGGR